MLRRIGDRLLVWERIKGIKGVRYILFQESYLTL